MTNQRSKYTFLWSDYQSHSTIETNIKDGDLVEVDADKGVVKIIKKTK